MIRHPGSVPPAGGKESKPKDILPSLQAQALVLALLVLAIVAIVLALCSQAASQ
jgi:hypothetical protein